MRAGRALLVVAWSLAACGGEESSGAVAAAGAAAGGASAGRAGAGAGGAGGGAGASGAGTSGAGAGGATSGGASGAGAGGATSGGASGAGAGGATSGGASGAGAGGAGTSGAGGAGAAGSDTGGAAGEGGAAGGAGAGGAGAAGSAGSGGAGEAGAGGTAGGAGGASGSSGAGGAFAFEFADVNHVLSLGQSLANGLLGSPPLSGASSEHWMFLGGVCPEGTLSSWVPLEEVGVETPSSGFARLVGRLAHDEVFATLAPPRDRHRVLMSCSAVPNSAYAALKKGTAPYALALSHVAAGLSLASQSGQTYRVRAVTNVHGESDHVDGSTTYQADLAAWQADLEADVASLTGQSGRLPMLHTQLASWTVFDSRETSLIPMAGWLASKQDPDGLPLVGPRYFLPHVDGVHLSNEGYRALGEYHAKAYRRVVLEGGRWTPLAPRAATRAGDSVSVVFDVPVAPLVFDDVSVVDPGDRGFEVHAGLSPVSISAVSLVGGDTVRIDLASPVPAGPLVVRYAWRAPGGSKGGPTTGPRGNLRDSDATIGASGGPLPNWCIHFELPVSP